MRRVISIVRIFRKPRDLIAVAPVSTNILLLDASRATSTLPPLKLVLSSSGPVLPNRVAHALKSNVHGTDVPFHGVNTHAESTDVSSMIKRRKAVPTKKKKVGKNSAGHGVSYIPQACHFLRPFSGLPTRNK